MIDFLKILLLGIGCIVIFVAIIGSAPSYRVKHKEWTKYDKEGNPVCGVGRRGYWTNHVTINGPLPFKQRKDGTWYDPKTGENCVTMTLKEMMDKYKDEDDAC
jgi:hypothetical protein